MTDRVGNMDALELVQKIRIGDTSNMRDPWDVKQLTDAEAAALIEQYGRRVPRAMLEEIEKQAFEYCKEPFLSYETLDAIAARYGVKIEEDGK